MTDARAGLWVCPNGCRREGITEPTTAYECADCGETMQHRDETPPTTYREYNGVKYIRASEAVHKADLRELVEEWREEAENADTDLHGNAQYTTLHEKANELSKLIEDE